MKDDPDSGLWCMEDAAAYVGLTRQRLNTMILEGRYPGKIVPYRPEREDSAGREKRVRFRILTQATVERIKRDREKTAAQNAEIYAKAQARAREEAKRPKKRRGRPPGSGKKKGSQSATKRQPKPAPPEPRAQVGPNVFDLPPD